MAERTNRHAVAASAARARLRHAAEIEAGGPAGIGRRMQLETSEALLGGFADMLDQEIPVVEIWSPVARALAGGLTSFLMSLTGGDVELALSLLPGAAASVQEVAAVRLRSPEEWIDDGAPDASSGGDA